MNKHTPGPWHITETGPAKHLRIDGPEDQMVAALFRENNIRNARLIAAAPELYAALKELIESCDQQGLHVSDNTRAVLTKVEL